MNVSKERALEFYNQLRREVIDGDPALDAADQALLQSHYPVMMAPERNPVGLAATIYAERRQHPAGAVLSTPGAFVLDAGCGFGSESFFFGSLGARVLAVDSDPAKIRVARLRRRYYEDLIGRALGVTFELADLDTFVPPPGLALTWLASVLAALRDQQAFLERVCAASRPDGQVMISDMNLWNPLFLVNEWRRRRRGAARNPAFAKEADLVAMIRRRGRAGARYFKCEGGVFDDVQFFSPQTLARLLSESGFRPLVWHFGGYVPPALARLGLGRLESSFARVPFLSRLGYFYTAVATKE